jgi:hypothetical protein
MRPHQRYSRSSANLIEDGVITALKVIVTPGNKSVCFEDKNSYLSVILHNFNDTH